jgi:hypothetical protein
MKRTEAQKKTMSDAQNRPEVKMKKSIVPENMPWNR